MNKEEQAAPQDTAGAADESQQQATPAETAEGDLQQQLAAAVQEAAEQKENYLRAAADLENVRRRSEKKIAEAHQYGLTDFALAIGEVRDCLEAALAAASAEEYEKLHEGVQLTLRKLVTAMDVRHIMPINPDVGVSFDPTIHMAIGKAPASEAAADGTVAAVVQAGYMLNGRVIRAANVLVAQVPEADGKDDAGKAKKSSGAK